MTMLIGHGGASAIPPANTIVQSNPPPWKPPGKPPPKDRCGARMRREL